MKALKKISIIFIISVFFFSWALFGCGSGKNKDSPVITNPANSNNKISPLIFGANYDWMHLAAYTVEYGDIIRDRSFRCKQDIINKVQVWGESNPSGNPPGIITWITTGSGDINAAGGKNYPGYVELTQETTGFTGITQQIMQGVKSANSYQVIFSSYGVDADASASVYLYNSGYNILASSSVVVSKGSWTQHSVTLDPSADENQPILGIYLGTASTIRIDEVRMFRTGSEPAVKTTLKSAIQNLGIKSLRWPGGTLTDRFIWTDSIGPRISRGELQAFAYYETPALGLNEFLDLCEELNIEPLVQVNILDTPADASDLVEYILGPSTSIQGAIRTANGKTQPWNVTYFEMGNEPSENYTGESLRNTGTNYASLTNAITAAMEAKAASLNKTIRCSAISEAGFQLADWLVPDLTDLLDMLYYLNVK